MNPEHIVSIILVLVAVAVIAFFLIAIVVELRRTHLRLITILGAVGDTVEKTDGLYAIVDEISADLAAGHEALGACVQRLEQRMGPPAHDSEEHDHDPHGPKPVKSKNVFTNY